MSKSPVLILGAKTSINLLPLEVVGRRKSKVIRRRLAIAFLIMIFLVFGWVELLRAQAVQAEKDLSIAQANTAFLHSQQGIYDEVRNVQREVSNVEAAQRVGAATEIDWKQLLNSVEATLPDNTFVNSIFIDQATPFAPYTQSNAPLQPSRIATVSFTATSSSLPQLPIWLDNLSSLPGFADTSPGSIIRNQDGSYSVNIVLHINRGAFSNRFLENGISK